MKIEKHELTLNWSDEFDSDGPVNRQNWRFEPMTNGLHKAGNKFNGKRIDHLRHAGTYGIFTDELAFVDNGALVMRGKAVQEPNPYRQNVTHNGVLHPYGYYTLHTSWIDTWTYIKDAADNKITDPDCPNILFKKNQMLEAKVCFEHMKVRSHRASIWTMPVQMPNGMSVVSDAYNESDVDGYESDMFEYSCERPHTLQMKNIGGDAGQTSGGEVDARNFGIDLTKGWHVISMLRLDDRTEWRIDGILVLTDWDLISDSEDMIIISREMNSGAKKKPQPHELPASEFLPPDAGLYAKSVILDLDKYDEDRFMVDYIRVYDVEAQETGTHAKPEEREIQEQVKAQVAAPKPAVVDDFEIGTGFACPNCDKFLKVSM